MKNERSILASRMWLLLLLDAAERAGIAPLSVERLHRIVYLANALAPVYDLVVPDGYILKYRRGPFFPIVHWDMGRLAAQGLIGVADSKAVHDDQGYWIKANYNLSPSGMKIVDAAEQIPTIPQRSLYLREVALAFATLEADEMDKASLSDVNYASAVEDTPVHYGDDDDNLAPLAAESLIGDESPNIKRLALHRYFQYLERAAHFGKKHVAAG